MEQNQDQDQALERLQPYITRLTNVTQTSYDETMNALKGISHKTNSLAKATLYNSLCVSNAREAFAGDSTVEICPNGHGAIIAIRCGDHFEIDLRFKKLDDYYRTYNSTTARQDRFNTQQGVLFDFMEQAISIVNLNFGSKPDATWFQVELWITCPSGRRSISWKYPVNKISPSQAATTPELMPTPPPPTPAPKQGVVPIPQKQPQKHEEVKNEGSGKS